MPAPRAGRCPSPPSPGDPRGNTSLQRPWGTRLPLLNTFCSRHPGAGMGRKKFIRISSPQLRAIFCPQPYFPISPLFTAVCVDRMWSVRACRPWEQRFRRAVPDPRTHKSTGAAPRAIPRSPLERVPGGDPVTSLVFTQGSPRFSPHPASPPTQPQSLTALLDCQDQFAFLH